MVAIALHRDNGGAQSYCQVFTGYTAINVLMLMYCCIGNDTIENCAIFPDK